MKVKSVYIVFLFLQSISCISQNVSTVHPNCSESKTLFLDGICLKNLGIKIPWFINYSQLKIYSYNKIDTAKSGGVAIFWDSATILDNINVRFYIHSNKKILTKDAVRRVSEFVCIINQSYLQSVIVSLESYLGCKECYSKTKTDYYWKIDGCVVRIMLRNNPKVDFLADKNAFLLIIQKI